MIKKVFLISLVILLVFALLGCGETTQPERVEEEKNGEAVTEEGTEVGGAEEYFAIGDTVKMGDLVFTLNTARWDSGDEFFAPDEGERWLVLDCTIENQADESTSISSMLMFSLYDEEHYSCNQEFVADLRGSLDGELGPGRKMSGEIAFSVSEEHSTWEFIFEPNVFGFGQAIFKVNEEDVK